MGSLCQSDTTVNQSQTYRPAPQAKTAITGALNQAQNVAQTPFQTPQAPVAGFSPDQMAAFQGVRNAQGQAQPYLDQAEDYFSGNRVNQFLNPYAANVMAGMKDLFGSQMSKATGNFVNQAGGVGADRVAVGQGELLRQQQLAAGQTLAGLYQPALNASQNAGFGIGALGPVAQNAALQGSQAMLGTGGLQQQLQQAQLNAPYQQKLAQIQWPYQNAQFNAGITASLAPGLGGTTAGQTTYPQPSPFGQIAGLGMAGAGAYGAMGGFGGSGGGGDSFYNSDGSMGYLPQNYTSPAYNLATNTINPNYRAARGGRINPYASGGAVGYAEGGEADDSMDDQIQAAEIQMLRDAGNPSAAGIHAPQSGVQPINIAPQSLVPTGQIPQIQPHIPQLQAPQQQSGGGGMLGQIAGTALKLAPMLLANRGGAVNGYAEGGATEEKSSYYDKFLKALRGINEAIAPTPHTGSIGNDMLAALPFASLGLRPSGIRLQPSPTGTGNPRMQIRGRFMSTDPARNPHGNEAMLHHPAIGKWPFIASGQLAANAIGSDDTSTIEHAPPPMRHDDADMMASAGKGADEGNPFAERWGEMAPPTESPRQDPLFMQSGMQDAPSRAMPEHVPLPRSNPFVPMALNYERKKREATVAPPVPDRPPPYRPMHMAEGGEVEDEAMSPFTRRQAALEESDPFERAALRTRESVRPTSGRKEGPLMGAAGTALAIAGSPEAMLASYAPRLGGALYGLAAGTAPTEAGEPEFKWSDPNKDRAKRLGDIEAAIALESERKTKSAPGTQKARIDSLAKEKEALLASRGEDYNLARETFTAEQDRLRQAAIDKKKAETSLFDVIPGTRAAMTLASPAASFLGGKYLGKRLSPWAAVPIGATAGAIEGGASIFGPTEMDINSLPRSSATRQEAEADLDKKSYWQRVALAAGVSGAAGLLGATKGYASTRPVRSNAPDISNVAQKAVQAASAPRMKTPYVLPDGSTVFKYPSGRWHTGKTFTGAPDLSKAKAGKPIPYASGGATDTFSDRYNLNKIRSDLGYDDIGSASGPEKLAPGVEPFGDRWNAMADPFPSELQPATAPPLASSTRLNREVEDEEPALPPRSKPEVEFDGNDPDNPWAPPQQKRSDLVDNPWLALMQAGLGTMAAAGHRDSHGLPTSPLAAIGQGGMKGVEALREQQTARMKQQSVDQAAKRLETEAARHLRAMGETERHHKAMEEYQKQRIGLSGTVDEDAVSRRADRIGNYLEPPPGPGSRDPQAKAAMDKVRERYPDYRGSRYAGEAAADKIIATADPRAISNAISGLEKQSAGITAFENTARKNGQVLIGLADKVDTTGIPVIERWIRAGRNAVKGDPDVSDFNLQYRLYTAEVAKIITNPNLTGVLTDTARKEVSEALSPSASAQQIRSAVKLLEKDFDNRSEAIAETKAALHKKLGAGRPGAPPAAPEPPPAAAPTGAPQVGSRKQFKQGWGVWDGSKYVPE